MRGNDSLTKWAVGIVVSGIVTMAGLYFAGLADTATAAQAMAQDLKIEQVRTDAKIQALTMDVVEIKETTQRLEKKFDYFLQREGVNLREIR